MTWPCASPDRIDGSLIMSRERASKAWVRRCRSCRQTATGDRTLRYAPGVDGAGKQL